jgi:hypothetical protein
MTLDELHMDFAAFASEVRDEIRGVKLDIREARLEAREQYNRFRLLISPAGCHRGAADSGGHFTSIDRFYDKRRFASGDQGATGEIGSLAFEPDYRQ